MANFIGVSNSLTGRIEAMDGQRCRLRVPGLATIPPLVVKPPAGAVEGGSATVMLRPERLHLSAEGHVDGYDNVMPARVSKAIYNGSETQYLLSLSDRLSWQARLPNGGGDRKRFLAGDSLFIRWNAEEAVVLSE